MIPFDAPVYAAVMSLAVPSLLGVHELTRTQRSALAVGVCLLLALGAAGSGALAVTQSPSHARTACRGSGARAWWRCGRGGSRYRAGAGKPGARRNAGQPRRRPAAGRLARRGHRPAGDRSGQRPGPRGPARPASAEPRSWRTGGRVGRPPGATSGRGTRPSPPRRWRGPGTWPTPSGSSTSWRGCSRCPACSRRDTCRTGAAYRTIAEFSWTGSAGRCGRAHRWRPRFRLTTGRAFVERHRSLIDRSTAAALAMIDNRRGLPPASADYWEVRRDPNHAGDRGGAGGRAGVGGLAVRGGRRSARARCGPSPGRRRCGRRSPPDSVRTATRDISAAEAPAPTSARASCCRPSRRPPTRTWCGSGDRRRTGWLARPAVWPPAAPGGGTGSAGPT